MTPEIQALVDLIQQFGIWIIFAWLYVNERKEHVETRKSLYKELQEAKRAHMEDIREIAGMRQNLYSVGQPAVPRDKPAAAPQAVAT